jgi:hypothetical protein
MNQLVYGAVIVGAVVLFFLPTIIAVILGTEMLWAVVLLNVTTWLGAVLAVIILPRKRTAPVRHAVPVQDDPRYLFGVLPPADQSGAGRRQDGVRAGASAWS